MLFLVDEHFIMGSFIQEKYVLDCFLFLYLLVPCLFGGVIHFSVLLLTLNSFLFGMFDLNF